MMDKVAAPPEALDEPIEGWRPALERWCHELRGGMRRHPWFLEIPIGPRLSPGPLAWLDRGLQALEGTRLTENEKANLILLLNGLVFWEARLDVELADAAQQPPGGFGALLSPLVDAERFPALRRAMDAGIFDDYQDRDADFAFDLARVLDGIERLVKERE